MKYVSSIIILFFLTITNTYAVFSDNFSEKFKSSINDAMSIPDAKIRSETLIKAIDNGTDTEVFYVFVLLFPTPVLNAAREANVCKTEISNSLQNVEAYIKLNGLNEKKWIFKNNKKIRKDTKNLIRCLHKYCKDGKLYYGHKVG